VRSSPEIVHSSAFVGAAGNVVSAWTDGPDSRVYAVTNGSPGHLWAHEDADRPLGAATLVGAVGDQPRRVRVQGNLVVNTNFASDSVTFARVDTLAVVLTVAVGDGPVGLDLKELGNGNVAALTTGLNDHTFTVTVATPLGAFVSSVTTPLPAECRGPGHGIFHRDGVLLSCRDSGGLLFLPGTAPQ
jgi:hypothetical protein